MRHWDTKKRCENRIKLNIHHIKQTYYINAGGETIQKIDANSNRKPRKMKTTFRKNKWEVEWEMWTKIPIERWVYIWTNSLFLFVCFKTLVLIILFIYEKLHVARKLQQIDSAVVNINKDIQLKFLNVNHVLL